MQSFVELNFELVSNPGIGAISNSYYLLTKLGVQQLAMRYDAIIRAKVNIKLQELEAKLAFQIPQTFSEALRLAAKLEEEKQQLLILNENLKVELNESEKYWTIAKYCQVNKIKRSMQELQQIGRDLSKHCRLACIEIKKCKTNDEICIY